LSFTLMTALRCDGQRVGSARRSGASTDTVMSPPGGVYFTAFDNRFDTTCVRTHEVCVDGHWIRRQGGAELMLTIADVSLHRLYRIGDDILK
jgi:hypothetical protein